MEARIRKLFSGKSTTKGREEPPLQPKVPEIAQSKFASSRQSYALPIGRPVIAELPRGRVPQIRTRPPTYTASPLSRQFEGADSSVDRPRTAPQPSSAPELISFPYARTNSGFSTKSPPNFSRKNSITNLSAAETQSLRNQHKSATGPQPVRLRINSKDAQGQRDDLKPGERQPPRSPLAPKDSHTVRVQITGVETQRPQSQRGDLKPGERQPPRSPVALKDSHAIQVQINGVETQNTSIRATASPPRQNRASKRVENRFTKSYVDLIDAASTIKPDYNKSRQKATGKRDYGEDVADRNIADFGEKAPIVPEYNYLQMIRDLDKANEKQSPKKDDSGSGHTLGVSEENSATKKLPSHSSDSGQGHVKAFQEPRQPRANEPAQLKSVQEPYRASVTGISKIRLAHDPSGPGSVAPRAEAQPVQETPQSSSIEQPSATSIGHTQPRFLQGLNRPLTPRSEVKHSQEPPQNLPNEQSSPNLTGQAQTKSFQGSNRPLTPRAEVKQSQEPSQSLPNEQVSQNLSGQAQTKPFQVTNRPFTPRAEAKQSQEPPQSLPNEQPYPNLSAQAQAKMFQSLIRPLTPCTEAKQSQEPHQHTFNEQSSGTSSGQAQPKLLQDPNGPLFPPVEAKPSEERPRSASNEQFSATNQDVTLLGVPAIPSDRNPRSKSLTPPPPLVRQEPPANRTRPSSAHSIKSYVPSRGMETVKRSDSTPPGTATSHSQNNGERTSSMSSRHSGSEVARAAVAASSKRNAREAPPVSYKPPRPESVSRGRSAASHSHGTPPMSPNDSESRRSSIGGDRVGGSPTRRSRGSSVTYSAFPPQYSSKRTSQASNAASERSSKEFALDDKPRSHASEAGHLNQKRATADSDGMVDHANTSDAEVVTFQRPAAHEQMESQQTTEERTNGDDHNHDDVHHIESIKTIDIQRTKSFPNQNGSSFGSQNGSTIPNQRGSTVANHIGRIAATQAGNSYASQNGSTVGNQKESSAAMGSTIVTPNGISFWSNEKGSTTTIQNGSTLSLPSRTASFPAKTASMIDLHAIGKQTDNWDFLDKSLASPSSLDSSEPLSKVRPHTVHAKQSSITRAHTVHGTDSPSIHSMVKLSHAEAIARTKSTWQPPTYLAEKGRSKTEVPLTSPPWLADKGRTKSFPAMSSKMGCIEGYESEEEEENPSDAFSFHVSSPTATQFALSRTDSAPSPNPSPIPSPAFDTDFMFNRSTQGFRGVSPGSDDGGGNYGLGSYIPRLISGSPRRGSDIKYTSEEDASEREQLIEGDSSGGWRMEKERGRRREKERQSVIKGLAKKLSRRMTTVE